MMTIVTYTNRKDSTKVYTLVSMDEANNTAVLTDKEGKEHTLKLTTLKKTFKKAEIEVEEPKVEKKALNIHQRKALNNIEGAYTYVLGGYENSVQDGVLEEMPPIETLFNEVYYEALLSKHEMFGGIRLDGGEAPACMRFAGKAFVREEVARLFKADGYEVPEELLKVPEKKAGHSNFVNGERVNIRNDEGERVVKVKAFTGMLIGYFKVEKETKTSLSVKTAKGLLTFDKKTGLQVTENTRFANRIELEA